ncbi:MAG: PEPxxWA-CTERM sorting domain-containing protein [Alphaproteobacteria bacterium]|nr:PEPxxWA-CTERM sorting domain-containing protein [Alphaproteobacteria bacterium]MBU0793800.1 PEPxxWA-CTERM sorting domain-containing protein [Alphaproteobacteria bacterium]MBU0875197.1 PEPxxWA-CTERM sorting domain-containing protein [Alphaproteobacteria bacterium]MBU1768946.1 PEPxxWA-CTERM sorting domain-containing protein [Alphaproteobacteria bacterium]
MGVHSTGTQLPANTLTAFVNQADPADAGVTFSSSGDISITGAGQATIDGEPLIADLTVLFAKGWDSITFNFDNAPRGDGTFSLLVNGSAYFDACSICIIDGGENRFTLSGSAITSLEFTFDPAISAARQFRVEGVRQAPIPEPAAWAMMIVGLGFAGGLIRRRATRVQFA